MLSKILVLLCLSLIVSCNGCSSDDDINIYISKGNTQCNDDGLTIEEATAYLTEADIDVSASQCGYLKGVNTATVCGGSTSDIYIHTINVTNLTTAENLGFTSTSSLPSEISYASTDCS